MAPDRKPLRVVIVGGSIAGLMCGVGLKQAGHHVQIIEQGADERKSYVSSLGLGPLSEAFLQQHDRLTTAFTYEANGLKVLRPNGRVKLLVNGKRLLTSWDALYFRLRSNFDQYPSSYYPAGPHPQENDGQVIYSARTKVLKFSRGDTDDGFVLDTLNYDTGEMYHLEADIIIGADGPDSIVRTKYLPTTQRCYVGYIAWRGLVPEREISPLTLEVLGQGAVVCPMTRQHCIMFLIPGVDGSMEPGKRVVSFTWYTNKSLEELDEILVDSLDGHRHHNIVPPGHVRADIWSAQVNYAKNQAFPISFFEVLSKIQHPFIQVITEFCSPRAIFEEGKVMIIGDALALFRPHTALGSNQAAFHTLSTIDYINGKVQANEWEHRVLRYSSLYWRKSAWWGTYYQAHIGQVLLAGLSYWVYYGIDRVKSWFSGKTQHI
ncbi:hypothetical protein F5Y02DRAFT_424276 [Annulohypoxylon stygium]|nr:hypothetical protein F5Y02DRAFT_424276 [Annulohypoxylon stygium]